MQNQSFQLEGRKESRRKVKKMEHGTTSYNTRRNFLWVKKGTLFWYSRVKRFWAAFVCLNLKVLMFRIQTQVSSSTCSSSKVQATSLSILIYHSYRTHFLLLSLVCFYTHIHSWPQQNKETPFEFWSVLSLFSCNSQLGLLLCSSSVI